MRQELSTAGGVALSLRPVAPGDEPLLRAVEADRRSVDFGPAAVDDATQALLLDLQYRARAGSYAAAFPDARHWIVLVEGEPVGRLLEAARPTAHHVVDIVLLASQRGLGVGTALMMDIQAEAARAGIPVELAVFAADERVVGWYLRLGFDVVDAGEVYLRMRWMPSHGR